MSFFVYCSYDYECVDFLEFETEQEVLDYATERAKSHPGVEVEVIQGVRRNLKPVQVVTKFELER